MLETDENHWLAYFYVHRQTWYSRRLHTRSLIFQDFFITSPYIQGHGRGVNISGRSCRPACGISVAGNINCTCKILCWPSSNIFFNAICFVISENLLVKKKKTLKNYNNKTDRAHRRACEYLRWNTMVAMSAEISPFHYDYVFYYKTMMFCSTNVHGIRNDKIV